MKVVCLLVLLFYLEDCLSAPIENSYGDQNPEERLFLHKKKKPCRNSNGRTFFDLNYSYVNIYNTYLSGCGGNGGHIPLKPPGIGGGLLGSGLFGSHQNAGGNGGNDGLFGLGLFNWPNWDFFNNNYRPNNKPKPSDTEPTDVNQSSTESNDYEDEKPVYEDHDDVVLDRYQNSKFTASHDITNFNPSKVAKRVNKEVDNFFKPLYDLFRK